MCWGFQLATEDPSYLVRQRASLMPCPSPRSRSALPAPAGAPQGAVAASAMNREPLRGSAEPLADAICQLGTGSSAAPLEALLDSPEPRLRLGWALVILPLSTQELPMAIHVTPNSRAREAQPKPLRFPGASRGLPRDPVFPPFPRQRGRSGRAVCRARWPFAARGWRLHPVRCQLLQRQRGATALGRPLRSRLPPSLSGRPPPASPWPAAGPIYSRGRLLLLGMAAPDGSGAEASEAAVCQGAPDWLTGLCNGYLVRVKASDWPRGTCNASSEDAGVRVPARGRGAAAAPPGMGALGRRCLSTALPAARPAPGAPGPSRLQQRSQRYIPASSNRCCLQP